MPSFTATRGSAQGANALARTLTVEQAARYLSVSKSYLNKLRTTGGASLPFHKLGSRVVYSVSDLDAYLDLHRRRSTSDRGAANEGGM
jgi:excisionase family DNA binding protein